MKCEKCQEPLLDSDIFCSECGTPRSTDRMCMHCGTPVREKKKFCPKCGKPMELTCPCGTSLKPNQKFCNVCGKKVEDLPTQTEILYCGKCKAVVERGHHFCSECGTAVTDVSHLTAPTPCSEEPVPGRVDKDGAAGATARQSESEFSSSNDGASEKEKDKKCLTAGADGEHLSPVAGGGEQTATTSVAETEQSQETYDAEAETSKTGGGGISDTPSEKEKDKKCLTAGADGEHLSPVAGGREQTATTSVAETGQSQDSDNAEAETSKTEGEGISDTPSEKEKDEKCPTAGTDDEHPSPVAGGGEQTVTTSVAKTGQSQETDDTEAETSEREGGGTDDTPGDSVADAPESSGGGETNKDTVDKGAECYGTDNRQSQPSDQADSASGDKGGAKLSERLPVPETKPDENQVTAETTCKDSSVDGDTNKASDPPETPSQGTEALSQVRSTADPEPSSPNSSTTSLQTADASLEVQNDGASSQVGDHAARKDGDLDLGATGSGLDDKAMDKNEENANDESESGEEQDADDDGSSSRSRDSSQHRAVKGKKRRQKNLNSKQRKKQRKREAQISQKHSEMTKYTATVRFHVVISKKFKRLEANNHQVFLCWTPDVKKPSPEHLVEMHLMEKSEKCGNLYEGSMDLNKLPKHPSKTSYKYCIDVDGKFEWEKIYHQKDHNTREVPRIPNQQALHKGVWDVYDWIAYPDGLTGVKDFFSHVFHVGTTSSDIFFHDMKSACALFLPSSDTVMDTLCNHVDKQGQTAEDFLRMIKVVALKSLFTATARDMDKLIGECVEQCLLEPLIKHAKTAVNSDRRMVVVAVFLLLLAENMKINLGPDDRNAVFRALLIKPDLEKRTCPDITDLYSHFPNLMKDRQTLPGKLVSFFLRYKPDSDPAWICSIPLLHLLYGKYQAFNAPPLSDFHRTQDWWGTAGFDTKVQAFKAATKHSDWNTFSPVREVFRLLSKAFKADPLMLRTFVATLNLKQLLSLLSAENLPAEIVLASLFFHLHKNVDVYGYNDQMEIVNILRRTATTIKATFTASTQVSAQEMEYCRMTAVVGVDLLEEVTLIHRSHERVIHSVVLLQLSILTVLTGGGSCMTRSAASSTKMILRNTLLYMQHWIAGFQFEQIDWKAFRWMMEESLQVSKEIPDAELRKQLDMVLSEHINTYIKRLPCLDKLSVCLELLDAQSPLSDVIAGDIYKYLEEALMLMGTQDAQLWFSSNDIQQQAHLLQEKMSRLFKTKWNESYQKPNGLLEVVFNWKPLVIYMSTLHFNETFRRYLTDDVAERVEKLYNFLLKLVERITSGRIKIGELQWLLKHPQEFQHVVHTLLGDGGSFACHALHLRKKEMEEFQSMNLEITCVLRFCQTFIETSDAKEAYQTFHCECENLDRHLNSICENPASYSMSIEDYSPKICVSAVPERFQALLPTLAHRLNSKVFCDMLKKIALSRNISPEDKWWEVLVSVWHEAETEWTNACNAMRNGTITLQEAEKLFSFFEKNNKWFENCKREVQLMAAGGTDSWVEERMEQFQCLSRLSTQRDVVGTLCQIKEEFGYTGDLKDICTIQDVDMTQPIGELDPSVVHTSKGLQDIDSENVQHFRQFGSEKCSKFVSWVRETMAGDGMKELKVFVDMALNYVGDDPKEMDKVRHLRAVITGYAPLIFQTGSEMTFLDRCCEVARNIKADRELPAKLESMIELVDWFDKIHKFHGSVEKTAMAQVDSITGTGILKIGRLQQDTKKGMDLDFSDVICLEVPADDEGQSEAKTYSYQDLVDLQSRLMLVVGHEDEGKKNVDQFISVMDSVVRLVKTYIQLCQGGCLLFLNWAVKFFFDVRGVCCIVEFFQGEDTVKQLKGRRDTHTLEDYMAEVAHYLDSSLDSWLRYVADKRKEFEELNMFTMDQLVFLQEQLVLLEFDDVSPDVFPLISLLQPDCLEDALQTAMEEAAEMDIQAKGVDDENEEEKNVDSETRAVAHFIQYMKDNGFSEQLAVKAIKADISPTDLDDGLTWCIDNADDEEENSETEKDAADSASLSSSSTAAALNTSVMEGTIASALQLLDTMSESGNLSLDVLATRLTEAWTLFIERVKLSGEDYLSLHHLGLVLKVLAEKGSGEYNRKLPAPMVARAPNLIVCPKGEVLKTVTSLYMFTKDAPLPQPDEVLLCTPHTTSEEVEMFLRRAFCATSSQMGKIHCLAFADSLDYDVGEQAEKNFKEFINTVQHPYQLVVICTSENELNSRITASLEKYGRSPPLTATDTDKLRDYLHLKFTVPEDDPPSAACVDPERLCVRVVKSTRSGMGKTLYMKRLVAKLMTSLEEDPDEDSDEDVSVTRDEEREEKLHVTVPLYEKHVNCNHVAATLLQHLPPSSASHTRLIHLDIAYEVQEGVDLLLYNLLVLGCITDIHGHVWRRSSSDLYLIEAMPLLEHTESQEQKFLHQIFSILPSVKCCSPSESLIVLEDQRRNAAHGFSDVSFDMEEYCSPVFQRPFHYLSALITRRDPKPFNPHVQAAKGNESNCLQTLIRHCGVKKPSWSELYHFVSFLNKQLEDFEHSIFCSPELSQDLPGFPAFVLKFLIHMSRDFATRSIDLAEESLPVLHQAEDDDDGGDDGFDHQTADTDGIEQFQMRRTWESSPHPYIFFNPDQTSMTFLGFTVDPRNGNLMNQTGQVLEGAIMKRSLYRSLAANGAPLSEDFDMLPRDERLRRLYQVMGVPFSQEIIDPDDTYELTTDNAKKILAIYMRFRCNIPVIIMGETGCGKTRLVKFLCALQTPEASSMNTMVIMKVHGGTTAEDIHKKVKEAEALARETKESAEQAGPENSSRTIYTVLFFDEANTTEAIGAIKEVMCDRAMNGRPIELHQNLKMVAACNPYRKHSQKVIERLEKAGLGYHINAEKTCDKLGRVPMRQLVYRVQPLPQSMLPLVWDFGQLDTDTECLYIRQMVLRYFREQRLGNISCEQFEALCNILVQSQAFMRNLKDECSFVSLRDADRTLMVTSWFLQQQQLLERIGQNLGVWQRVTDITKSLVLALAVCYRAGLPDKQKFENKIFWVFLPHFALRGPREFQTIIDSCQDLLLENVKLGEKIARNQALKENVFMMVVCVELRIPLFLVGKPGSSKSLAKAIVADAMQGNRSCGELFKTLKEAQMVSFQCSPLATADGILGTFRQCAHIQHDKDRDKFVAVAVLDEIGLAEDSPRMPLKALHPLLEDGCEVQEEVKSEKKREEEDHESEEEESEEEEFEVEESDIESDAESERIKDPATVQSKQMRFEKVAFIGISNWALDPAKMNRGILVQRDVPDEMELVQTAESICDSGETGILEHVWSLLKKLAKAYLGTFEKARQRREFFGLRDFYSLVKMVHAIATREKRKLTKGELHAAIRRNFGGLAELDPVDIFKEHLTKEDTYEDVGADIVDTSYSDLLRMALQGDDWSGESRYLLLLTENYGGLHILTDNLLAKQAVVPIFGSSFPKDQEYTQICRNINRIKVCMETGKTVVLLNLDNLYESLYDALNQYYSYLAKARYVDLGLGTHRVKCKVDTEFRLIVVAEKQTVYDKFPIPLINRLEKHFLTVNNLLNKEQCRLERQLKDWVQHLVKNGTDSGQLTESDVLIGYHSDTAASIVLRAWEKHVAAGETLTREVEGKIVEECRATLLWCATPDAVIRLQDEWCSNVYFNQQQHDSLAQYLKTRLQTVDEDGVLMAQITTHSKMLTNKDRGELEQQLPGFNFTLLSLQAFHTEQQFQHQLSMFLGEEGSGQKVLLVHCERGNLNQSVLQCAQYCVQSAWSHRVSRRHVIFIVHLPRVATTVFSGFMGGCWHCAHVDDLHSPAFVVPSVTQLQTASPAQLLASAIPSETVQDTPSKEDKQLAESARVCLHPDFACHLLASCVQGAVARIQDGAGANGRSTHRIALLLHCLENREDKLFLFGILRMVSAVLHEKESANSDPKDSHMWLSSDAANVDWVKKAGTLRRAWVQCLERHVIPVLAGVMAFLDTNHNLDLLQADGWVLELWLKVINDPALRLLQYSDLLSMSGHPNQLKEFACRSTFLVDNSVSPALPFSWVIYEQIEAFLTKTLASEDDYMVEDAALQAMERSAIGHHLQGSITDNDVAAEFLQRYLSDLLHVHFRLSPQQHELLMQCMNGALEQEGVEVQAHRLSQVLVRVHRLMVAVRPRLQAVLDMAACHPQAIQALQEKRRDPQTLSSVREAELVEDVLLLEILTQELAPQKNQLNTDEGCRVWLDHHDAVAPVISRALEDADSHCAEAPEWPDEELRRRKTGSVWLAYGSWCCQHLADIRCLWAGVTTVKLFIDYMSPLVRDTDSVRVEPINYNLLWNLVGAEANLKSKATLTKVDRYLKLANSQMVKSLLGDVGSCSHCEVKLQGPPTVLPCGHRLCDKCYMQEARASHQCPECHQQMPADFRPETSDCCDKVAVDKLVRYQQQTSAFLMAVVSQLCFAGQEPPEPDAVEHIFSYVIRRVEGVATVQTQQLTLRDEQMDPSPVLRSFILRLLLKHSEDAVSEHIDQFLSEARAVIEQHMTDSTQRSSSVLTELSLLLIHCTENLEYERDASVDGDADAAGFASQCWRVKEQLHRVRMKLESSPLELATLIALGQLRYALSACAALLHRHVVESTELQEMDIALKDLAIEVSGICTLSSSQWPKNFLVKQLCRDFGVQSYTTLMQCAQTERCLQWIKLDDVQQVEEVPDRYLVCGADYRTVREEIMHEMRGHRGQLLMRLSEMNCSTERKQYLILLALHREVPMAFSASARDTQPEMKNKAIALVQSRRVQVDEELASCIVNNSLGAGVPRSTAGGNDGQSLAVQSVVCILTHLQLALQAQQHQLDLLGPLATLVERPADMTRSYLPTMPEDNVDEIIQAMGIDHSKTLHDYDEMHETAKLWECPNGHRYTIGDCGNPSGAGRCPECGVQIGALRYHVAAAGNTVAQVTDRTQPGHTLGAVEDRSREAVPERGMSAAACVLVRFLTHAVLFISASQPGQAAVVSQMIRPAVREADVTGFFWGHLHKDLQVLQHVLGWCCDDVYLLLHHLCHQLAELPPVHFWYPQLASKMERKDWEQKFSDKYIRPVLQQADAVIKDGNDMLLSDTRQGQSQLLNLVFEVGEQDSDPDTPLQHTAAAWKYRTRITVDHFFRQFQLHVQSNLDDSTNLPVLKLFFDESHHLRALYHVPDILALQRRVLQQFHHRLSRVEASQTTIKELLDAKENPELKRLVEAFSKAWDIVKDLLLSYRCRTAEGGLVQLPEECHTASVSENSPVGMLLPDTEGPGRCAYLLIHYLLVQHNHFLQRYCPHTRQTYDCLPEVPLHMITRRHLVSYSPQADLLPLVLAHCNYSLHLGHGDSATATRLEYDFQGFELQLKNSLLLSKSRVQRGEHGVMEIETMSYCADTTNSRLINRLREKIDQAPLDMRVQRQIASEFRESLPDICQSIDSINTTLTFLLTLRVTADQSLQAFMTDTLRMKDTGLHSRKAQQHCRVKHVQALWLLLCFQRARILATHNEEAFDDQGGDLRKELTEEQKEELTVALRRLSPDRVELVSMQIYQCIVLHLIGHSKEDFVSPDNYDLKWLVCDSLENSLYSEATDESLQDQLTIADLEHFPKSILASRSIPAWAYVLAHLNNRQ